MFFFKKIDPEGILNGFFMLTYESKCLKICSGRSWDATFFEYMKNQM